MNPDVKKEEEKKTTSSSSSSSSLGSKTYSDIGKVSVNSPARDESGKTATDRIIEANKARLVAEAQEKARYDLRPVEPAEMEAPAINIAIGPDSGLEPKWYDYLTTPLPAWIPGVAAIAVGATTALLPTAAAAETAGLTTWTVTDMGTASTYAVNAATKAATSSWLIRAATGLVKNPLFVASVILSAIGSYPFAGFIKEEALQTLGFGVNTAIQHGDMEGAKKALDEQKDILDPGIWSNIMQKIPFSNVVNNLKDFYDAARVKLAIDEKLVADMSKQVDDGETKEQYWERVNQEQEAQDQQIIDYYNEQRKQLLQWEDEARVKAREEEAKFWLEYHQTIRDWEEEDRKAAADFWLEYRKRVNEIYESNRPSNLNFGLLG